MQSLGKTIELDKKDTAATNGATVIQSYPYQTVVARKGTPRQLALPATARSAVG